MDILIAVVIMARGFDAYRVRWYQPLLYSSNLRFCLENDKLVDVYRNEIVPNDVKIGVSSDSFNQF